MVQMYTILGRQVGSHYVRPNSPRSYLATDYFHSLPWPRWAQLSAEYGLQSEP